MSELLELGAERRRMILSIYSAQLAAVVREPTTAELIQVEYKLSRLKGAKQAQFIRQLGLKHLVSIDGFGVRNESGELVTLVTEPGEPGYDPEWKRRLGRTSLGLKVAAQVVGELYVVGEKKPQNGDDELDLAALDEDIEPGEAEAAPQTGRGRKTS